MKNLGIKLFIYVFSFLASLMLYQKVLMNYILIYVQDFYNPIEGDTYLSLFIVISMSLIAYFIINVIAYRRVNQIMLKGIYLIYFISLFFFLFLKNIGLQGITYNPFEFVIDFINGYARMETIFNVIYFIPLGFLFKNKIYRVIPILFGIEISQYLFSLGIFDFGDIILNGLGCWIGYILRSSKFVKTLE